MKLHMDKKTMIDSSTSSSSSSSSAGAHAKVKVKGHADQGWHKKAMLQLKDAIPKLKRTLGGGKRTRRQALLRWFENQRKDLLLGLQQSQSQSSGPVEKVTNLKHLLALPLEIHDLETCLNLGVERALQQEKEKENGSPSPLAEEGVEGGEPQHAFAFNLTDLDIASDAEFLARIAMGESNANASTTATLRTAEEARELLERLQHTSSSKKMGGFQMPMGKTAQLTALLVMIAQVLIGAQLLRRFRTRKAAQQHQQRQSVGTAATSTATAATSSAQFASLVAATSSTSSSDDDGNHRSDRCSRPTLHKHLSSTNEAMLKAAAGDNPEPDDDRTAETDSISLSEGQPQKEDQHMMGDDGGEHPQHDQKPQATTITPTESSSNATADTAPITNNHHHEQQNQQQHQQQQHSKELNVLAQMSFSVPILFDDKFSLRMSKLKSDLYDVKQQQKSSLTDSRHVVQMRYQETNQQYVDLTKRLERLTNSIPTRPTPQNQNNSMNSLIATPTGAAAVSASIAPTPPAVTTTTNSASAPTAPMATTTLMAAPPATAPSPPPPLPTPTAVVSTTTTNLSSQQLQQAQAQVEANNEERLRLLHHVTTLQQDLKGQQERHAIVLQQREAKMGELSTRIEFLSAEMERRVAHSKRLESELTATHDLNARITTLQQELQTSQQQQDELVARLQESKRQFTIKEQECQQLLQKLRQVPPPSPAVSVNTPAAPHSNQESAREHQQLIKELQEQLEQQDQMNQRTLEMTRLLEQKREDIIARTKHLEDMSRELNERQAKLEVMEATAAAHNETQSSAAASASIAGGTNQELQEQLRGLQDQFDAQALECEKLTELLSTKTRQLRDKEGECHELTTRLEKLSKELRVKEERIQQLEQDVQDKEDLAAQNEAITMELQVQQELQEKMNQTTLQMIKLLEEKEKSNADLSGKLEALTTELESRKE